MSSSKKADKTVMEQVRRWAIEWRCDHNDGWVQRHYKDKLEELHFYLSKILMEDDKRKEENKR